MSRLEHIAQRLDVLVNALGPEIPEIPEIPPGPVYFNNDDGTRQPIVERRSAPERDLCNEYANHFKIKNGSGEWTIYYDSQKECAPMVEHDCIYMPCVRFDDFYGQITPN
jgi:hypothetical protein